MITWHLFCEVPVARVNPVPPRRLREYSSQKALGCSLMLFLTVNLLPLASSTHTHTVMHTHTHIHGDTGELLIYPESLSYGECVCSPLLRLSRSL